MTANFDIYTTDQFQNYLLRMEEVARSWLREELSDTNFLIQYHSTFSRCVSIQEEQSEPSGEGLHSEEELLESFREIRKLLDSMAHTITDLRRYGQHELDPLDKLAVLSQYLVQLKYRYEPTTAGNHDRFPQPS